MNELSLSAWLIFGTIVGATVAFNLGLPMFRIWVPRKSRVERFGRVRVDWVLRQRLKDQVESNTTITISGGDEETLIHSGTLRRWLKRGAKVNCTISAHAYAAATTDFRELKDKFPKQLDLRTLRDLTNEDKVSDEIRRYVEQLQTFHFILVKTGAEKRIWIEGMHKAGSRWAMNCEFTPPAIANHDPRFEALEQSFAYVARNFANVIGEPAAEFGVQHTGSGAHVIGGTMGATIGAAIISEPN